MFSFEAKSQKIVQQAIAKFLLVFLFLTHLAMTKFFEFIFNIRLRKKIAKAY